MYTSGKFNHCVECGKLSTAMIVQGKITPELLAAAGTEQSLQSAYFCWLTPLTFAPGFELLKLIHAVPSGGERAQVVGTMMKGAGVRKGVWDICLAFPRGRHHMGYIEMKRPVYRNRKAQGLSQDQIAFGKAQLACGNYMQVAFDWTEARDFTMAYLALGEFRCK